MTATRLFKENESETTKGFSEVAKGKICGFCGVTKWNKVPAIWKEIEKNQSDQDLRAILKRHWNNNQTNLNSMYYKIY